jgi:hypothetical protein
MKRLFACPVFSGLLWSPIVLLVLWAIGLPSCSPGTGEAPADLHWDYAEKGTWEYRFHQESSSNTITTLQPVGSGPMQDTARYRSQASGDLIVRSFGEGRGRWSIEGLVLSAVNLNPIQGTPADSGRQEIPPIRSADRNDRGFLIDPDADEEALFPYLFPLPSEPLAEGESLTDSLAMPMPALASTRPLTGLRTMTHAGTERKDGVPCVRLEIAFSVVATDLPPEMEGRYTLNREGKGTAWFAFEEGRFQASETVLSSVVDFDAGPGIGTMRIESSDRFQVDYRP